MRTYALVLLVLLLLTGLTVALAVRVHLGVFGMPVALLIATAKGTVVLLYFMHLKQSSRLTWVIAAAGAFWLGIMLTLTLSDFLTRGWPRE